MTIFSVLNGTITQLVLPEERLLNTSSLQLSEPLSRKTTSVESDKVTLLQDAPLFPGTKAR